LAALLDGPKHGYQLRKQASRILGPSELHNNVVYPLLRKFTAQGWVTRRSAPGERGQTRQQYTLTAAGRQVLIDRLAQFGEREAQSEQEFIARVGLFELLDTATRERILHAREQVLTRRDQHLARLQEDLDLGAYGEETVAFLRRTIANELGWLGRLRRLAASTEDKTS
jgi:DNA-binding PadR family transcriptional regulator